MYLEHFKLKDFPFTLTPNTEFYCGLLSHQTALNTLIFSLQSGEGFIKITGEVGCGKTLLCRMLLNLLEKNDQYVTAYLPNPDLDPQSLRKAIAQELNIAFEDNIETHRLLHLINQKLIEHHKNHKHVVVIIDESQVLSNTSLEALRLLTNLETETHKLLQVVLFGQPELDNKLNLPELRQIKQRIVFAYHLPKLKFTDLKVYLQHRLAIAGHTYGNLFSFRARRLLYRNSRGIPRLINLLSHKALLAAYGAGKLIVDHKSMLAAIKDTEITRKNLVRQYSWITLGTLTLIILSSFIAWRKWL